MSDEIKNSENESPKLEPCTELPKAALDQVAGGITKVVDQSSPTLYQMCSTGKHITVAKID